MHRTVEQVLAKEARRIDAACPKGATRIVLGKHGKMITTQQLAQWLRPWMDEAPRPCSSSSSADGLAPSIKATPLPLHCRAAHCLMRWCVCCWPSSMVGERGASLIIVVVVVCDGLHSSRSPPQRHLPGLESPRRRELLRQIGVHFELLLLRERAST